MSNTPRKATVRGLVGFEQHGHELARQRGATAEAEHHDLVAGPVGGAQVRLGLGQNVLDVAEGRGKRHVDHPTTGGIQPTEEWDRGSVLTCTDAVVVEGHLPAAAPGLRRGLRLDATAEQDVQFEDVADALVLLEAVGVGGLVARAVETENQGLAGVVGWHAQTSAAS